MGKKSAILKKLEVFIKTANNLKDKKNYDEAVRKYREGINFLRVKATDMEGREEEVSNIIRMIDQTHSANIMDLLIESDKLVGGLKFAEAMEKFNYATEIANNIDDIVKIVVLFSISLFKAWTKSIYFRLLLLC